MEKESKFVYSKNNFISDLTKTTSKRTKIELKIFKIESPKHLSEPLTGFQKQINVLKEQCNSKDMVYS